MFYFRLWYLHLRFFFTFVYEVNTWDILHFVYKMDNWYFLRLFIKFTLAIFYFYL